jgi:hypothetical protein
MRGGRSWVNAALAKAVETMFTGLESAQFPRPDADSDQSQGGVAYRGRHPPDLSVSSLGNRQAQP